MEEVQNKPVLKIKGKVQDFTKKEKKIAPKRTNFLLTVNLNQRYKDEDEFLQSDIEMFELTINEILNNIEKYVSLKAGDVWDYNTIKNVDIQYTIEKGLKTQCLHVHILFSIEHFTTVKLNYQQIKNKFQTDLGLNNCYLFNRVIKNTGNQNVLDYLDKYT